MNSRYIITAVANPQNKEDKWKASGTGYLCCDGIPIAQFIEPVGQDGRYIPMALNLLAGHDLSSVVVVDREVMRKATAKISELIEQVEEGGFSQGQWNQKVLDFARQALASLNAGGEGHE